MSFGISRLLGFAEGGRIPNINGFKNDGAIIRADAGEQILSRDLSNDLEKYLDQNRGGGNSQNMVVQLYVGEKQLADVMLNLNQRGFRTS